MILTHEFDPGSLGPYNYFSEYPPYCTLLSSCGGLIANSPIPAFISYVDFSFVDMKCSSRTDERFQRMFLHRCSKLPQLYLLTKLSPLAMANGLK